MFARVMASRPVHASSGSLPALVRLCHELANASSLAGMFESVVKALVATTGFTRAAALAFDGAGVMRFRAAHGLSAEYRAAVDGHSPWQAEAGCPEPILVDDVRTAPELAALRPVFERENVRSLAFLPLCGDGRLLGKFMLYSATTTDWRSVDLGFATAAADLLASFLLREAAQERLQQAQRMESLGLLAGGIAHDFNNMLTSILGYGDLIRAETLRGTPARTYVDELLRTVEQAAERTRQLLGFARPQLGGRERVDLAAFVGELLPSLMRAAEPRHSLRVHAPATLPPVFANRAQLQQMLWILVQNARDAMPDGGVVDVMVGARRDAMVELVVRDHGRGLDDATRRRLFEPAFGNRGEATGIGLGLPTCYAIVQSLGGDIAVRSSPGRGTSFVVALPVHAESTAPAAAAGAVTAERATRGTVLLVEDQEHVMGALVRQLTGLGYRVRTAVDGRQALALLAGEAVDVVVSDVVMPELGGIELARMLRARTPPVPVLLMTGFVDEPQSVPPGVPVLTKPFLPRELAAQLQQLLPARAGAAS